MNNLSLFIASGSFRMSTGFNPDPELAFYAMWDIESLHLIFLISLIPIPGTFYLKNWVKFILSAVGNVSKHRYCTGTVPTKVNKKSILEKLEIRNVPYLVFCQFYCYQSHLFVRKEKCNVPVLRKSLSHDSQNIFRATLKREEGRG